jgi:predicted ATP-grasp superfamily ATP-dependent carboligase
MVRPDAGRVLVTDGEFKHSLGIVRALAARGHEVHVTARSTKAPSVHSRAVKEWHEVPVAGSASYAERLKEVAAKLAPVTVVAVGNHSVAVADALRDQWPDGVRCPVAPHASLVTANDKAATGTLARSLDIEAPEERIVSSVSATRLALATLGAPLVLKSASEEGRKVLRYVRSVADIEKAFAAVKAGSSSGVLAQRYVVGQGYGYAALYWHGRRIRHFVHRRVREWPPTGGTSACAESVPSMPEVEQAGGALLDALAWHGVAMVEFKGLIGGHVALIEINAKFWGSHDLALAAGVDFPGELVALAEGRVPAPQAPYRAVRMSWPFGGDLWHGLARPAALPGVLWDAISPGVAHTFIWGDLAPTGYEVLQWARSTPGAWRELRNMA